MTKQRSQSVVTLWPEVSSTLVLVLMVFVLVRSIIRLNGGTFTYLLDDTYIHLAIAKNLALHHVWGITRYQFASAASSPLWVLLLAAGFLTRGGGLYSPLILNLLFAAASLFVAGSLLRRRGVSQPAILASLLALVVFIPLPTVILDGMEHSLHVLLVLLWVHVLDEVLRVENPPDRPQLLALAVLAFLVTATRFESAGLVGATAAVLFLRKQRGAAILLMLPSLAALGAYAAFSLAHGWHALPNSVLIKVPPRNWHTAAGVFHALGGRSLILMKLAPHMGALFALAVLGVWWLGRSPRLPLLFGPRALLLIFVATTLIHLQFAQLGWFYRYEAYLVAFGIVAITLALQAVEPEAWLRWRQIAVAATLVVGSYPLTTRAIDAWRRTPPEAKNIYDQQWQMGRFLEKALNEGSVALNDIGVVSFVTDEHVLDLIGLASLDVADEKLRGLRQTQESIGRFARQHGVDLAVIYETTFRGKIPEQWKLLGRWTAPEPIIMLNAPVVSFYAVDPSRADELRHRLEEFSRTELPGDVPFWIAPQ